MAADTVSNEFIEPYLKERASLSILHRRNEDLIDDLNTCFINLIDAKRPEKTELVAFGSMEMTPQKSLSSLTRDGKLLAQRDVVGTRMIRFQSSKPLKSSIFDY